MTIFIDEETEVHCNELPKVSQPIMADVAALLPLNIQGSFHYATLVYGFVPSIVATQKILRKRKKKSTNWNFSILGLENSFSLGSECAQMPDSQGAFQTAGTLCRPLSVTGYF